jgi:hypothetical protein
MADTPLEVHWIIYPFTGEKGWATVWGKGVENGDYIFYGGFNGRKDTGFSQAVHQAKLSNRHAGFGANVKVCYGDTTAVIPSFVELIPNNHCFKYCPICWLFST